MEDQGICEYCGEHMHPALTICVLCNSIKRATEQVGTEVARRIIDDIERWQKQKEELRKARMDWREEQ